MLCELSSYCNDFDTLLLVLSLALRDGSLWTDDIEMGRKGSWFSSVKKALSPEPKEPKDLVLEFS